MRHRTEIILTVSDNERAFATTIASQKKERSSGRAQFRDKYENKQLNPSPIQSRYSFLNGGCRGRSSDLNGSWEFVVRISQADKVQFSEDLQGIDLFRRVIDLEHHH
jgi:hypothetical protein